MQYLLTFNDWSRREQWILFPSNLGVSLNFFSGNLEIWGKRNSLFPKDLSLSDLFYSKANGSNRWKTNNHFIDKWCATAVNIFQVTVNCFLFDVIVFTMLPAHGSWQETVWLLDVMWPWTNYWACSSRENTRYIAIQSNSCCFGNLLCQSFKPLRFTVLLSITIVGHWFRKQWRKSAGYRSPTIMPVWTYNVITVWGLLLLS